MNDADDPPPSAPDAPARQVAVALQDQQSGLPRVVAAGHGAVAEQILTLAFANGVKVRQDADLAQVLAAIDLDQEIPIEAIATVAEILAHVYRANDRLHPVHTSDGTHGHPAHPARETDA